jgi:hypothetical protein
MQIKGGTNGRLVGDLIDEEAARSKIGFDDF